MSLDQAVTFFNSHLDAFNPRASLRHHARFLLQDGRVSAELADMTLWPSQQAILDLGSNRMAGREARLDVVGTQHHGQAVEALYFLAWDREDVTFLDRFLRVLHALNHLASHGEVAMPLVVDVHRRHVRAVQAAHGLVFERLLAQLELVPRQLVLRLPAEMLLNEVHARQAAQSFVDRGYKLLAHGVPVEMRGMDWQLLARSGVRWVTPLRQAEVSAPWFRDARAVGMTVWWRELSHPTDLERVASLGPGLVSGDDPALTAGHGVEGWS